MGAQIIGGDSATEEDIGRVQEALARASRDVRDLVQPLLQRLLRRLVLERSRRSRSRSNSRAGQQATQPSGTRPQNIGDFRSPRHDTNFRQLAQGIGPSDTERQFEREISQPSYRALALCFAVDFDNRLEEAISVAQTVHNNYGLAQSMLEDNSTTIFLWRGRRPPARIPAGAYAWATMAEAAAEFGDDSVVVFDPFFGEPGQNRMSLLQRAGRQRDFELFRAALLVHELLHWRLGPGHHSNGFLRNPQNYEFFMILRYCTSLLSPRLNWPYATPDLTSGLDSDIITPGLDQLRRW